MIFLSDTQNVSFLPCILCNDLNRSWPLLTTKTFRIDFQTFSCSCWAMHILWYLSALYRMYFTVSSTTGFLLHWMYCDFSKQSFQVREEVLSTSLSFYLTSSYCFCDQYSCQSHWAFFYWFILPKTKDYSTFPSFFWIIFKY